MVGPFLERLRELGFEVVPARPERVSRPGLDFDPSTGECTWLGRRFLLGPQSSKLLAAVAGAPGMVTYAEVERAMYGGLAYAGLGRDCWWTNVRSAVQRLREAFKASDSGFAALAVSPGVGLYWDDPKK